MPRAAFVYDDLMSRHELRSDHPMRPVRLRYTYELLSAYRAFEPEAAVLVEPRPATDEEIGSYIDALVAIDGVQSARYLGLAPAEG